MEHFIAEMLDENKRKSDERPASTARYASLTGPLLGVYYRLPPELGTDEAVLRVAMRSSKLGDLWCDIYTYEQVMDSIRHYGGVILDCPRNLDYDSCQVHSEMQAQKK